MLTLGATWTRTSANKAAREGRDGVPERKSGRHQNGCHHHAALQQRGHVVKPPARVTHTPGHCSSVHSSHPPALQKGREGGETFGAQRCVTQCKFE